MKADEWLKRELEREHPITKGMHVVPECGDCEYWGAKFQKPEGMHLSAETVKELEDSHRECDNEDSPVIVSPVDFGCTHGNIKE